MLKTDLDRKIFMAKSFLDSATLHDMTPKNVVIARSLEEAQAKSDDTALGRKFVTHFLYAMVFELSIKIIWEIEQGKSAPHHHNILCLYRELSPSSQQKISDLYDIQVSNMKQVISKCNGRRNRGGQIVNLKIDLQSLENALEVNEPTVKNFKYDGQINGKSSVLCSTMWTDNRIMILPQLIANAIIFPKALLEYAISLQR